MKLIEALKLTKDLARKAEDLRAKIANCSADMDFETPVYPDQATQVQHTIQESVMRKQSFTEASQASLTERLKR